MKFVASGGNTILKIIFQNIKQQLSGKCMVMDWLHKLKVSSEKREKMISKHKNGAKISCFISKVK